MGVTRDVSDRKKLDDQTRDLYHQLLQAEKMAALGQTVWVKSESLIDAATAVSGSGPAYVFALGGRAYVVYSVGYSQKHGRSDSIAYPVEKIHDFRLLYLARREYTAGC